MHNSRSSKIDELLKTVQERVESRRADHDETPQIDWHSFSPKSQEVLMYFGIEAPDKLNTFCCTLEDALLELVDRLKDAQDTIADLHKQLKIDE